MTESRFQELVKLFKEQVGNIDATDISPEEQRARLELRQVANSFVVTYSKEDIEQYNTMCSLSGMKEEPKNIEMISLPKQIYSPWAYTAREDEKAKINKEIYNEIKDMATIKDYSIGYAHRIYTISPKSEFKQELLKDGENEYFKKLALIADNGNLCFGYSHLKGTQDDEEIQLKVFTD